MPLRIRYVASNGSDRRTETLLIARDGDKVRYEFTRTGGDELTRLPTIEEQALILIIAREVGRKAPAELVSWFRDLVDRLKLSHVPWDKEIPGDIDLLTEDCWRRLARTLQGI